MSVLQYGCVSVWVIVNMLCTKLNKKIWRNRNRNRKIKRKIKRNNKKIWSKRIRWTKFEINKNKLVNSNRILMINMLVWVRNMDGNYCKYYNKFIIKRKNNHTIETIRSKILIITISNIMYLIVNYSKN